MIQAEGDIMCCLLKRIRTLIISYVKKKRNLSSVNKILKMCDDILEEKGYYTITKHSWYDKNTLYVNVNDSHDKFSSLPKEAQYEKDIITVKFNSVTLLLEASLDLYYWCCLLPPLKNSRYEQFQRRIDNYVNGKQDTDIA